MELVVRLASHVDGSECGVGLSISRVGSVFLCVSVVYSFSPLVSNYSKYKNKLLAISI